MMSSSLFSKRKRQLRNMVLV